MRDFLTRYADSKRRCFEALDALDALAAGAASRTTTDTHKSEFSYKSSGTFFLD